MSLKIKKSQVIFGLPLLLLLFQYGIIYNTDGLVMTIVNYADELIAVFFLLYIMKHILCRGRLTKYEKIILVIASSFMLVGIVSTIFHGMQPIAAVLIDAFACAKFMIVLVGTSILYRRLRFVFSIESLNSIVRLSVLLLFSLLIINVFVNEIFEPMTDRHLLFVQSQRLFFGHAAELAETSFFCLIILFYNERTKSNFIYMIMASLLVVSSIRIKEIAIVMLFWIMYFYFVKMKIKTKSILYLLCAVAVLVFGYDQFSYYYGNTETARSLLTITSIRIANEYFPLGAGFATFGSAMSNTYYSPLYYKYGLNTVWGLGGGENYNFISDTFWPIVIGEFGWIGFILIIVLFWFLFRNCFSMKTNMYCYIGGLSICFFLLVVSLGASSIFNPFSILCAAMLSYFNYQANLSGEYTKWELNRQ